MIIKFSFNNRYNNNYFISFNNRQINKLNCNKKQMINKLNFSK